MANPKLIYDWIQRGAPNPVGATANPPPLELFQNAPYSPPAAFYETANRHNKWPAAAVHPALRKCDNCGHDWGEHHLVDVTPPVWPCWVCDCKCFVE